MLKLFIFTAITGFLVSFAAFMVALISRFNIKRIMMMQGKNPNEDSPDFAEMCKVDKKLARKYQLAIRFWVVSLIILIISIVAAYYYK